MKKIQAIIQWISANKGKSIFIFVLIAALFVAGYLILKFIIFPIAAFCLLVWALCDFPVPTGLFAKVAELPALHNIYALLTDWAYRVTANLCAKNVLPPPIRMPAGISETAGIPPIVSINGIEQLQFYIPLQMGAQDAELNLDDVKILLQAGFVNMLTEGALPNQPYMPNSGNMPLPIVNFNGIPIIQIADIKREKLRLVVTAYWVTNQQMAFQVRLLQGNPTNNGGRIIDNTDRNY